MFSLRSKSKPARRAAAITLFVAGCALPAAIPATGTAAPPPPGDELQLVFEPGSYDFGLLEANRSNGQANFQLRNAGNVSAPIYSINVVGSGSGAFWTGNSDCFSHPLEPNATCSIQVNFGPYDAVPFAAQLRAESDGGAGFTAELSGEGGRPALTAASNPTNFGSVPVGSAGVTRTIDVTNQGNMPASAFIAVISGGAVGSFHLLDENCTGVLLSPAATCNLQVSFDPISTGAKTARLFLVGDGDGGAQITLTGVGLEPEPIADTSNPSPAATAVAQPRRKHRVRRKGQRHRGGRVGLAYKRSLH